jgi:hypothetical protein
MLRWLAVACLISCAEASSPVGRMRDVVRRGSSALASVDATISTSDWNEAIDPKTGRTYYWHRKTRETTWINPAAAEETPAHAAESAASPSEPVSSPSADEASSSEGPQLAAAGSQAAAQPRAVAQLARLRRRVLDGTKTPRDKPTSRPVALQGLYLGTVLLAAAALL